MGCRKTGCHEMLHQNEHTHTQHWPYTLNMSMHHLEGAVDQRLVQVNDHTDLSLVLGCHLRQKARLLDTKTCTHMTSHYRLL